MASRRDTAIREFTVAALDAEASSAAALCALLGVAEPVSWPPDTNDADTRAWFRAQLATRPDAAGWLGYYVVAGIDGVPTLVGTAGYKGPPDREGMVEIGYSIVKTYRRRGIATAALELLLERAFNDARVVTVSAETPTGFAASRGLLEKCGFVIAGASHDPEAVDLVVYALRRSAA